LSSQFTSIIIKQLKALRVISVFAIILSVLVVSGVILGTVYEGRFGNVVVNNLNNQLESKLIVENVSFSVIKKFPNASIELNNVVIKSNKKFRKNNAFNLSQSDTLLKLAHVFLEFNIVELFQNKYNVKALELNNGNLNVLIDKNGLENYIIWKENPTSNKDFQINLNNVIFKNITLLAVNQYKNYHIKSVIKNLIIKGNINKKLSTINSAGEIELKNLKLNDINYTIQRTIKTQFQIQKEKNKYIFNDSYIVVSGLKFSLSGIYLNKTIASCDISITTTNNELNSLIHLLPEKYYNKTKKYAAYGDFSFNTHIKGQISKLISPHITTNFNLKNGSFLNNKTNIILNNLNIKGQYSNGKLNSLKSSFFNLKTFSFTIDSSTYKGNLSVNNFVHPELKIHSKLNVDLQQVQEFFKFDTIQKAVGNLKSTFWLNAHFDSIQHPSLNEIKEIKLSGESYITNATIKLKGSSHTLTNINAKAIFADNNLRISRLSFNDAESNFALEGVLLNLIPYLFFQNQILFLDANITSRNLNLEKYFTNETPQNQNAADSIYVLFPKNINYSLGINVNNLTYDDFSATNITGIIHYKNKIYTAENVKFNSMFGFVNGRGNLIINQRNNLELKINCSLQSININSLFSSFHNFGQKFIVDKNLAGIVDGNIIYSGSWDKYFNVLPGKIFSQAELSVKNGELIDFEPMQSLSKYIDSEELKHIRFSNLDNTIFIKNSKVIIPKMNIASTAFNIGISGEHTFTNNIDYHLNILLSELLSKKFKKRKKHNEEFTNIEDDGLGRTTIYLSIKGTVDNFKVNPDKKRVRKKIKKDLENEKHEIKTILKNEFSSLKKDSIKSKSIMQNNEKFIFEFEDDTLKN